MCIKPGTEKVHANECDTFSSYIVIPVSDCEICDMYVARGVTSMEADLQ